MTKDPETGTVPRERLMDAYKVIRQQEASKLKGKAAIDGITWTERGPNNVGGRTRVVMFDAADATNKTVFAGSVAGGLWKTTNIFADKIEWTPVNEFFGNMAITAMAQDPSNPSIMYFGTGEGFFNTDAVRGDGIWKSTDGGDTWLQLGSTTGDSYSYIQKLVVDNGGNLVAGTRAYQYVNNGGIYRSTNGGTSFTRVLDPYTVRTEFNRIADLELAADGKTWFASNGIFNTDGIYRSTDSAKTWSRVYDADATNEQRIELVCAPSNTDYVYALVQGSSYSIQKIMKSTDGGTNWTTCTDISWTDQCGSTVSTDFTRNQAFYNLIGVVDPNDEEVLTVAGINIFRTNDEGSTWSQLSSWVGCGGYSEVHSDHHALVYYPNSSDTMLNGNDGGIYLTKEVATTKPTWTPLNNSYNVTQYYAGAMHPTAGTNYFLTGAQDNGTQRYRKAGVNATDEVTGGDGGYCHIDQEDPDTQLSAYTNNNVYITTDGFLTQTYDANSKGNFINASDYDSDNKILYSASDAGYIYRRAGIGGAITATNFSVTAMNSSQASTILVSPSTPTNIYVGTEAGRVVRITSANGTPSATNISTGLPTSATVSCIAEDPNDATHLLVTYSNYGTTSVWESTNTGNSWTSVEGDLPDMPIRGVLFSPIGGDSALLATELGVWSTTNLNGASTAWEASNTGLANCRVDMLQYRASDSMVMASTLGRGMYTTAFFSERVDPQFGVEQIVVYAGTEVDFYDDSYGATSWQWDFDGIYESTDQNPSYTFGAGGYHTVALRINGTTTLTKTDYIQVIPNQGVPYTNAMGGDMESNAHHFGGRIVSGATQLWERGAPTNYFTSHYNGSNAWVTDLDGDMTDTDIECELLTPNFNFSASGTYTLSFKKSMEIQYSNGPMAARVEYSTNKGKTWSLLGTNTSGGTGWYNRGPGGTEISYHIFSDGIGWTNNYNKSTTSHDVSSLAGNENVCFRVLWKVSNNFSSGFSRAGFLVDDFAIAGPDNDSITGGGIETGSYSKTLNLGGNDSATYYSSNGKIIAKIWNNSSHDFGNTTVEIDAIGTSATNFDTLTDADRRIFSKTIKITPTSNSSSANVKIAMYYSAEELSGWNAVTGLYSNDIQLFKTTNTIGSSTIAQGVYPTLTTLDSTYDNDGLCVTGIFSNGFSGVGAGGGANLGGGPLPVELIQFDAIPIAGRKAELNWTTASELNNKVFEVERSIDGGITFTKIGFKAGHGNSYEIQKYDFIDNSIPILTNKVLYRLNQIDFDGTHTLSDIRMVKFDANRVVLNIYPNPARDILNVQVNRDIIELKIYNMSGIEMPILKSGFEKLDVSSYPTGVYFIDLETTSGKKISKFSIYK
ncbi:T9SS type A sorting domain-containing protein [Bacteroidia bacterium]|nr:T9SS type A sorting domain-containing protein [Bacteroidia bacterium]